MTERIELGLKDANAGCACCASPTDAAAAETSQSALARDVFVDGMTCSHCVSSVTDELSSVDGVESVTISLNAGATSRVTIHSAVAVDPSLIKAAVEEAGYTLAPQPS